MKYSCHLPVAFRQSISTVPFISLTQHSVLLLASQCRSLELKDLCNVLFSLLLCWLSYKSSNWSAFYRRKAYSRSVISHRPSLGPDQSKDEYIYSKTACQTFWLQRLDMPRFQLNSLFLFVMVGNCISPPLSSQWVSVSRCFDGGLIWRTVIKCCC